MRRKILLFLLSIIHLSGFSQINNIIDYANPKIYEIGGITIKGAKNLNNDALITISGLSIGDNIKIPGDNISSAINKLWDQELFSNIDISIEKIIGDVVFINIDLTENSRLSKFKFKGKISKSDITTLKEKLKLKVNIC